MALAILYCSIYNNNSCPLSQGQDALLYMHLLPVDGVALIFEVSNLRFHTVFPSNTCLNIVLGFGTVLQSSRIPPLPVLNGGSLLTGCSCRNSPKVRRVFKEHPSPLLRNLSGPLEGNPNVVRSGVSRSIFGPERERERGKATDAKGVKQHPFSSKSKFRLMLS
jgi:hypothetical protein